MKNGDIVGIYLTVYYFTCSRLALDEWGGFLFWNCSRNCYSVILLSYFYIIFKI